MTQSHLSFQKVIDIYRKEYKNFGFIPRPRLQQYYEGKYGKFFISEDGFIIIGSLKSKITPIYAVYIYPDRRNGSTNKVRKLLDLLPKKEYRVRCWFGKNFWVREGLQEIRIENTNHRKRDIFILEGKFKN